MNKQLFSMVFLLLIALTCAQNKRNTERDHIVQIRPNKQSDIPPNIRKCLNVTCGNNQQCFYGRCIKYDAACATVQCERGFRCKLGQCIKQLHRSKKMLCTPLAFKLEKQKCSQDLLQACRIQTINKQVCGFNIKNRKFFDYKNPCQACADTVCDIDFYYQTSCDGAPRICSQKEQCMNGLCTAEFKDSTFKNYRSCNQKADCKPNEDCAFHKCIDRKDLYNFLSAKSEEQAILVKI